MAHPENCLNCYAELRDRDKFCYNCGQSALHSHKRIIMSHITHEVVHALTHADKGFFYLIKELATQPGITIKEYLAGKHKKYFNPFSFFFIVLGLYVLSNSFFKPFDAAVPNVATSDGKVYNYPATIKTEKQKAKYNLILLRVGTAMNFMNTRTNIVLFISTPFIAFIMFLLYRKHLYYAEQLVVVTFINAFLNLLSIFIFTPLMVLFKGGPAYAVVIVGMFLAHFIYMSMVYFSVLNMPHTIMGYLRTIGSVVLSIVIWTACCGGIIAAYILWPILMPNNA
jgi:hypothetical protein